MAQPSPTGPKNRYPAAVVATEVRLIRAADGQHYPTLPSIAAEDFTRYLEVADRVVVVARVDRGEAPTGVQPIDVEGVQIAPLPNYRGLKGIATNLPGLVSTFAKVPLKGGLAVGRVPEIVSMMLHAAATLRRADEFTFFVADPLLALPKPGTGDALKRAVARRMISRSLGVVYVTREWLQQRYAAPQGTPTLSRSNVRLSPEAFRERSDFALGSPVVLSNIGTMGSYVKGQDLLLRVLKRLIDDGRDVRLDLVGDGTMRPTFEGLAAELGVTDHVRFLGATASAQENWGVLDASDVFVFGSRTEGLPRAVIEAMARHLPVISTRAGGVEELLTAEDIVDIDDEDAFYAQLTGMLESQERRRTHATRNAEVAKEIYESTAPARFTDFLREVTHITEENTSCAPPL